MTTERDATQVTAVIETPAGRVNLSVDAETTPKSLMSLLPLAREIDDALIALAGQAVASEGGVSCRSGCTACCHHPVPLAPVEAMDLYEVVEAMDPKDRERVKTRFERMAATLRELNLVEGLTSDEPQTRIQASKRYFRAHIPCPFLSEQGHCSIYEDRPFACREHLVFSEIEACSEPDRSQIKLVPLVAHLGFVMGKMSQSIWPGVPESLPLVQALDWAAEHAALMEVKAPGHELVDTFFSAL